MARPIDDILSRLDNPKPANGGWAACCPGHDDKSPSLSISEGDDGRVLLCCHAGCSVDSICTALGLDERDLFVPRDNPPPRSPGNNAPKVYDTPEAFALALGNAHGGTWYYHHADGTRAMAVVRKNKPDGGKDLFPLRPHGDRWALKNLKAPRPLYGLPDLASAGRVYVVEGEKCVEAARTIGLTATTSVGGCKAPSKSDWTPLVGRDVVILPDADEAGQKYAANVAGVLVRLEPPAHVRIVTLPDLPPGGDIVDWIDAHDSVESDDLRRGIEALADSAPPWSPCCDTTETPRKTGNKQGCVTSETGWQPFPVDALPSPLRDFVTDASGAIGCAPSFVALPLLSGLAAAIGNTRQIQLKPGWTEPSVLWVAIVGESGTQKSPAIDLPLKAVRARQARAMAEYRKAHKQWATELQVHEAELLEWKKRGRKAGAPQPEAPDEPVCERFWCSDVTIEALADRLGDAPRGLLCVRDELAGLFGGFDQYKGGRGGDVAHWLTMFNARDLLVDRKTGNKKTIYVPRAAVSICGGIQPEALGRSLGREHFEDGLAARFLLAFPPRQPRRWTEAAVSVTVENRLATLFEALLALQPRQDDNDNPVPITIPLSPCGKAVWVPFFNRHANEQTNLVGDLAAAWSKHEGIAARLSLIIHLVRAVSHDPSLPNPETVDGESVGAAVRLIDWFGNEVRRVYQALSDTEEDRGRRQLLALIDRLGGRITPRDLQRADSRFRNDTEAAEVELCGLVKDGHGEWESVLPGDKGGRPTRVFRLTHPLPCDTTPENPEGNRGLGYVTAPVSGENVVFDPDPPPPTDTPDTPDTPGIEDFTL